MIQTQNYTIPKNSKRPIIKLPINYQPGFNIQTSQNIGDIILQIRESTSDNNRFSYVHMRVYVPSISALVAKIEKQTNNENYYKILLEKDDKNAYITIQTNNRTLIVSAILIMNQYNGYFINGYANTTITETEELTYYPPKITYQGQLTQNETQTIQINPNANKVIIKVYQIELGSYKIYTGIKLIQNNNQHPLTEITGTATPPTIDYNQDTHTITITSNQNSTYNIEITTEDISYIPQYAE